MNETLLNERDIFLEAMPQKKSNELAYLDKVAWIGFSFLGVASLVILFLLAYMIIS